MNHLLRTLKPLYHNKSLIALALILAIVSWYGIREITSFEKVVKDVPIRILLDSGWSVHERSASLTDVLFRGSREDIGYLNREQVEVVIDLRGKVFEGSRRMALDPQAVRTPPRTIPVSLRPNAIELSLDRENVKEVPVRLNLAGSLPEGMEIDNQVVRPAVVTLSGPSRRLAGVETVRTAPVSLDGQFESFTAKVGLLQPGTDWTVAISPEEVEVQIELSERIVLTQVEAVPVRVLAEARSPHTTRVEPALVKVSVRGQSERMQTLVPSDIILLVRAIDLEPGLRYVLPVESLNHRQFRVVDIEPASVTVWVEE